MSGTHWARLGVAAGIMLPIRYAHVLILGTFEYYFIWQKESSQV